jgi:hypothetical protein
MFDGQLMVGSSVSSTVTVNEQLAVRLAASVTVNVCCTCPTAKLDPDACPAVIAMLDPAQLSLKVGWLYVTVRLHCPAVALNVWLLGQLMIGSSASTTVMVKLQYAVLPAASCETYTSCDVPTANVLPLPAAVVPVVVGGGLQLSVRTGVV